MRLNSRGRHRPYMTGQRLRPSRERGFTLLEAIIALLVVAIGLIGPLKMMAHALASSSTANARNVAALHAASLVSMIQANPAFWRDGEGRTADISLKDGALVPGSTLAVSSDIDCTGSGASGSAGCSPAELAGSDLVDWAQTLGRVLPDPGGSVQCSHSAGAPTRCIVTVRWHEHFVGSAGAADTSVSAATATSEDSPRSFISYLSF